MNRMTCLIALLGLLSVGCGRVNHKAAFMQSSKPISLSSNLGDGRPVSLVRHFHERERQVYLLFHWIPLNDAGGVKAAEKHLAEGDGITNLRIKTYYGPVDLFFTLITAGLITSYTIDGDGDIVIWSAPSPSTTTVAPPSGGSIVVPPSSGGTVIIPPARP